MKPADRCYLCGKSSDGVRLQICVICHRLYCRTCSTRRNGKELCSQRCADLFFFGDDEEGDGDG